MKLLAIDCSSETMSVAVARIYEKSMNPSLPKHPFREEEGHKNYPGSGIVSVSIDSGFRHIERIMAAIDYCMSESGIAREELELLACASGPGSFTGLRIAMATVKGIAMGLKLPFVTVPSLDVIAADWEGVSSLVVPVMDAKRGRFYSALYEGGKRILGPMDASIQDIISAVNSWPEVLFVGPDASMLEDLAADRSGFRIAREARRNGVASLARLAAMKYSKEGGEAHHASPVYLRASDAEESMAMKGKK